MGGEYKIRAITDNPDAYAGLSLAGVHCQQANTPDALLQALAGMCRDTGLVIITSTLAAKSAAMLERYREKNPLPMLVIIPEEGA